MDDAMTSSDQIQLVFRALSDPTRRSIISMLAQEGRPIGHIAAEFDITRPAVAKHLTILREGGVITVESLGRERIHRLNPAALKAAADWLSYFDRFWDDRLAKLKKEVERKS